MYAPRYAAPPKDRGRFIDTVVVKMEPHVVMQERTVETPVEKAVWYYMPTIHFVSGSAAIDTKTYAEELDAMVRLLNEVPDTPVRIYGYADHSGTEQINKRLTQQRAEALRDYLIDKGIALAAKPIRSRPDAWKFYDKQDYCSEIIVKCGSV